MRITGRIGLAMLLLAWAGAAQAAGTLRYGMQDDPDTLDPAQGGTFAGRVVFASLCDKLIDFDARLDFVPQLATAWAWSPDAKTLTLTLRQGVTFQDGEPFDAAAVKTNLDRDRTAPESARKSELKPVSSVEVADPHTVRLHLSQPYAPLIAVLADRAGMMVSPKAIRELGKDLGSHPVCAGPFSFVERAPEDHITLRRFPGYWNAAAIHLDRIVFRPIADSTVRRVNLQAGQLDIIEQVAPTDVPTIQADPKLRLARTTSLGYETISINMGHAPGNDTKLASDPRVREAFEASLDRAAINQVVMDGLFVPDNQAEAPQTRYWNPHDPVPPRDIGRARKLLKEAGVDHLSFGLRVANTPREVQLATVIQAMAQEAGIDVKVVATETNTMIAAMNAGDYQASIVNWSGRADPDFNVAIFLACDGFQNWGKYCNPHFDELLERARAVTDPVQRQPLYWDAASTYLTDRPDIFLFHNTWLWGMTSALHGFTPVPDGLLRPQGLELTGGT